MRAHKEVYPSLSSTSVLSLIRPRHKVRLFQHGASDLKTQKNTENEACLLHLAGFNVLICLTLPSTWLLAASIWSLLYPHTFTPHPHPCQRAALPFPCSLPSALCHLSLLPGHLPLLPSTHSYLSFILRLSVILPPKQQEIPKLNQMFILSPCPYRSVFLECCFRLVFVSLNVFVFAY